MYDITIHEVERALRWPRRDHCPDASQTRQFTHKLKAIAEVYQIRIAQGEVLRLIGADVLRGQQARFREFLGEIGATLGSRPTFEYMATTSCRIPPTCLLPTARFTRSRRAGTRPPFSI